MTVKVDDLARLLEETPTEVLRRKEREAKIMIVKGINMLDETVGTRATMNVVNRAADLLAGHWSPEFIAMFIES